MDPLELELIPRPLPKPGKRTTKQTCGFQIECKYRSSYGMYELKALTYNSTTSQTRDSKQVRWATSELQFEVPLPLSEARNTEAS